MQQRNAAPIAPRQPTWTEEPASAGVFACARSEAKPSEVDRAEPQWQPDGSDGLDARPIHPPIAGFTLIEIMAVVVIIGLLTGIVGTAIIGRLNQANATTAKTQIKQIEAALDFYRMDNGRYPTTEQGLEALVSPSGVEPAPRNFRPEGYLQGGKVPADPWGLPYEYEAPGRHNPYGVDIWSFGADGQPGGTGADADVGNWSEDAG
jgi:general secretion pathway protein G